jgi:phage gpG-like protein
VSEAGDALRQMADRADNEGGRAAAEAMAGAGRDEIQRKLGQRSHARGTPTPSAPGTPPARVSGALQGSIHADPPAGGGGLWYAYVGPRGVVYAGIQQHGGQAGRNHASHLPPRPYMDVHGAYARIAQAGASAFYRVVIGG